MKLIVQNKPEQFEAEQFLVNQKPWPKGVCEDGKGGYIFVVNVSLSFVICDGDWIVDLRGKTNIVPNDIFRRNYIVVEIKD